jgi:benzoyl-CoA reductase/2-hydroxyglutaryl-CoA dehydratase subunit BcrC/BadD/HgdB
MAALIVAETTCDGKKKMYELLARERPMYVLELPQKADDPDAFEHWLREVEKLKDELERRFGVRITEEKLRSAVARMNRERALRRELAALMQAATPPLTGRQLLQLRSIISAIPEDFAQYEKALAMLRAQEPDASLAARTRVLLTGVPVVHGAEKIVDLIESNGGLVVCSENCTGLKPLLEDVQVPSASAARASPHGGNGAKNGLLRAIAEKYFHLPCSVMTPNNRRLETLERLVAEYRPQCIIELIWQACLTYDVESHRVKDLAARLKLPYLRIETDYSPSDAARVAMRVQALFETRASRPSSRLARPVYAGEM